MKLKFAVITGIAALMALAVTTPAQTTITTSTNGVVVTNMATSTPTPIDLNALGISGSAVLLWNAIQASDILQATNWAAAPYLTYAPSAADKVGGGLLAIYNVPQLTGQLGSVGAALGGDWLGTWSLVSGNVTIQTDIQPLAKISWLSFLPDTIRNVGMTPFALAGAGMPMSGGTGAATIWDVGDQIKFGHWMGGRFGVGVTWGEWMNAGKESGHRYHFFLSYQYGF